MSEVGEGDDTYKQDDAIGYGTLVRYGRSRSFKVIEIGTNRKPVCNFLLKILKL